MQYDLIIEGGICVLPWGEVETGIGVRDGRIASLSAGAADEATDRIDARGLHVLPGLIDPHVHLRDPGDASIESIHDGDAGGGAGRGGGGVRHAQHGAGGDGCGPMVAWKQEHAVAGGLVRLRVLRGGDAGQHGEALGGLRTGATVCAG